MVRTSIAFSLAACCCTVAFAQRNSDAPTLHNDLLDAPAFLQIPGPNPILETAEPGRWDSGVLETAGIFKDQGVYYLYYHATGTNRGYQVGVATSDHPIGPFTRHGAGPILPLGEQGSWEGAHVACAGPKGRPGGVLPVVLWPGGTR
ncbi:hypothetical protein OAS39_08890 [Pirellulales bacterium]|nr:hypothetical protein [Pirellulales bacterium]